MKISEISVQDVAEYLRLDDGYNKKEIEGIMEAVEAYISGYTHIQTAAESPDGDNLDQYEDLWIPYMVLCQDAYDNRAFMVDGNASNKVVESILNLHGRGFV